MADSPQPNQKKQNFVVSNEAPRFSTRILANISRDSIIFSFGLENPTNPSEAHMHTRIAMPLSSLKSFSDMLTRITEDLEIKKAMQGIQYDQIPSDA